MYGDDERQKVTGRCPECGKLFETYGPSTLSMMIGGHLYHDHDYPTRFYTAHTGPSGYPDVPPPDTTRVPFDLAFYDGARLTPFDHGFLRPARVKWCA